MIQIDLTFKPFDLKPSELKKREVIYIDIANDPDPTNVILTFYL